MARDGTSPQLVTHQLEEILAELGGAMLLQAGEFVGDGPTDSRIQDAPLGTLFGTPRKVLEHRGYKQVLPACGGL